MFAILCICVLIVWLAFGLLTYKHYFIKHPEYAGTFGDMFGITNSLFAGLGFAGLFYTIMLQRKELSESKTQSQKQIDISYLQHFDNTFFNMISIHHELIRSIQFENAEGRGVLQNAIDNFNTPITAAGITFLTKDKIGTYSKVYFNHIEKYTLVISPYLQSLASIYETIEQSEFIDNNDRIHYYKLLRPYVSLTERRFLYYHLTLSNQEDTLIKSLRKMDSVLKIVKDLSRDNMINTSHILLNNFLD